MLSRRWLSVLCGLGAVLVLAAGPAQAQTAVRAPALVDPAWVAQNLNTPGVHFLDLRSRAEYLRGHVPGALSADYGSIRWRPAATDAGAFRMMEPTEFASLVGGFGIDSKTHVVLYTACETWMDLRIAIEVFWLFRSMGHRRLSILNVVFSGYAREGGHAAASRRARRARRFSRSCALIVA